MSHRAPETRIDRMFTGLYRSINKVGVYVSTTPKKNIFTDGLAWIIFLLLVGIPIVCLIITPFLFHMYYPDLF